MRDAVEPHAKHLTKAPPQPIQRRRLDPEPQLSLGNPLRIRLFPQPARLRRAGAGVTLGRQAELLLDHAGSHLYIECKRPFYEHNIEPNVAKARDQLRQRFDSDPRANSSAGLIAVSISKAINPGSKWLVVDQEDELEQGLSKEVNGIHGRYGADYDREIDPRLLGRVYHIFTPAFVRKKNLITAAWQTEIFLHTNSLRITFPISGDALKQLLQSL